MHWYHLMTCITWSCHYRLTWRNGWR